ncbi:MAG TPA: hypothetical protein VF218_10455 [Acidothermaceae bacterium]
MTRGFVVQPRFCGPPRSGNGGYVAGRLASFVDADVVEVTLRSPPPLGSRLEVSDAEPIVELHAGEILVAQAKGSTLEGAPPESVSYSVAAAAAQRYAGRREHPFPTCFVCGTQRADGDGMRLEPGAIGAGRVAAAWRPHDSLGAAEGADDSLVAPEFVWAALDCPGGWAAGIAGRPMVLGRLTARVLSRPRPGDECVVVGQWRETDGRKAFTSSALFGANGELLAHGRATWLEIDPARVVPR